MLWVPGVSVSKFVQIHREKAIEWMAYDHELVVRFDPVNDVLFGESGVSEVEDTMLIQTGLPFVWCIECMIVW